MEKILKNQTNLSLYDNSWYQPGSTLKRLAWYICSYLFINTYFPFPMGLKRFLLRLFGADIASDVVIKPKVNIKYPWFLKVDQQVWIGEEVWIDNLAMVTISTNACLSQGCYLLTGNHNYKKHTFDLMVSPIVLEAGAWIGAKATVCPGVTVGSHAILTVQSVATSDLLPYGIYQGNPAVLTKKRTIEN
ncbi:putative colanic acid biosynthesis acetyltransferase WcaF [Dyadobacter jejuensis]|uniref:Putative colanic acid biosynthesis acetyltransferase WcaF n=1 Tax=Dyadobacter jejuensis TaxID=1082580 RepID=A0A316AHG9_9BACT|nr:WcaF family extracellular polysaccharide biosynthesis acetyltransferase [Dyadobacter jejuensis]PWJ56728.1 putative colanic acid biosynthesis acetyltransferase WcaF [Dyadobacter jejuensis]